MSLVLGFLIAALAYQYGFPGVIVAAIVVGGIALAFRGAERGLVPLTPFVGFLIGLVVVSGTFSVP